MKTNWIRIGVPAVSVLAVLPACLQQTGGVHGDLYGLFAFVFSLPAQYALGALRDAGVVQGRFWESATLLILHFIAVLILTHLAIAIWIVAKAKKHEHIH